MSQEPGQLVASKYRLERPLARGGMGSVWVARHVELDVDVALKFRRGSDDFDSDSERRFKREARAAAQLRGPHIVHIHDYGLHEGVPYIAMELLAGEDLGQRLEREGPLPLPIAAHWLQQAAKALRVVHQAGIVHRDIKPSNLFLAEHQDDTVLKMLDFGIAKTPDEGGATTSAGLLLGSPAYMSPEQARGNPVDARSDLWSLGAVFYRMLTGQAPFEGSSSGDILVKLCTEDVAPASRVAPHLGAAVDAFFRRALARDPADRFRDVDELLANALRLADAGDSPFTGSRATPRAASSGTKGSQPAGSSASGLGRTTPTGSIRISLPAVERTQASSTPVERVTDARPWLRLSSAALVLTIGAVVLWLGFDVRSAASEAELDAARPPQSAPLPASATNDSPPVVTEPIRAPQSASPPLTTGAPPSTEVAPSTSVEKAPSLQQTSATAVSPARPSPAPPSTGHISASGSTAARATPEGSVPSTLAPSTTAPRPPARQPPSSQDLTQPPPVMADPVFGLPMGDRVSSGDRP